MTASPGTVLARHDPRAYDALAEAYARHWGPRYHDAAAPVLAALAYGTLREGARVLDLCCGTGHLTSQLVTRGFAPIGIDGSPVMLGQARRVAPAIPFVCADAAALVFAPAFEAVLCTFDSLNHVLHPERLSRVFIGVHRALEPGGLLVFDINTEDAYRREWGKSSALVSDHEVLVIRGGYDAATRLGHTDVTMFWRDGERWRRRDARVWQRPWSAQEVTPMLVDAGFGSIAVRDAVAAGMAGDIAIGRIFVSANAR